MAKAMNPEPETPDTNALSSIPKRYKNGLRKGVLLNCKTVTSMGCMESRTRRRETKESPLQSQL